MFAWLDRHTTFSARTLSVTSQAQTMSPAQMMHVMSLLTEIKKLIPSNWRVESHHGGVCSAMIDLFMEVA